MKPIMQSILHTEDPRNRPGDCFRACIASLLEMEIENVPHFIEQHDWWNYTQSWLKDTTGLQMVHVYIEPEEGVMSTDPCPDVYYIMSGDSPRGVRHSVIAYSGEMVHDPHPDGGGVSGKIGYTFLVPIEIARKNG